MTREQAREEINSRITELPKAKKRISGHDTYVCPFCDNGSGSDGDGISTYDGGKHWKCFKCDETGDYLDFLKKIHGETESEIFTRYGLTVDAPPYRPSAAADFIGVDGAGFGTQSTERQPVDYKDFFLQANKALHEAQEAISYLQSRGISSATANRFMIGYCPEWKSPAAIRNGKNPPPSRRIVIPTSRTAYTVRSIDPDTPEKYRFMKEGDAGYFNKKALQGAVPVFIVEAAFDALSICEVGGEACALGSTSGIDKFLSILDKERPTVPLILSLDNDEAGQAAQSKLKAGLEARKIAFYEVNTSGEYKDPNEHLQCNKEAFTALVHSDPAEAALQEVEADKAAYLETSAAYHIGAFIGEVAESANTPAISTGFEKLDAALDGGLYAGLYVIGAISSLGKTTFILQVADQIAQRGHDVLIFSLEMSRYELMAKSISRLTLDNCAGNTGNAKTTRGILAGAKWRFYSQSETGLIKLSTDKYQEYSRHIFIHEGIGNIGMAQITEQVQRHISFTGNAPVVVIDYLQIIAPHDERATDKQIVDRSVLELKRLSRDKKIPVMAVSSFNRDNYTAPVNMASFKESGAVEYSSDVLLGMQLAGMDELSQSDSNRAKTIKAIEEKKKADPRKAQLKILKNRNGKIGLSLYYDYYPMFNTFREADAPIGTE